MHPARVVEAARRSVELCSTGRSDRNAPIPVPEIKELYNEIPKTDERTDGSIPIEVDFLPPAQREER
jgi:hypothetical protein